MNKVTKILLLILRLAMGWVFFWSGITKVLNPEGWTAKGYLLGASGPFAEWFRGMAGSSLTDNLNMWGMLFIGIGLLIGGFTRIASMAGALLMILYYVAHLDRNITGGVIDDHIVYLLIFVLFLAIKVGDIWGLDKYLRKNKILRKII